MFQTCFECGRRGQVLQSHPLLISPPLQTPELFRTQSTTTISGLRCRFAIANAKIAQVRRTQLQTRLLTLKFAMHFIFLSVATPAERRGDFFVFAQNFGGDKVLESAREIFLSGWRGAKNFSDTFFGSFFVFSNPSSYRIKQFRGQFRSANVPP